MSAAMFATLPRIAWDRFSSKWAEPAYDSWPDFAARIDGQLVEHESLWYTLSVGDDRVITATPTRGAVMPIGWIGGLPRSVWDQVKNLVPVVKGA